MASNELIEKVAGAIADADGEELEFYPAYYNALAQAAISTILAALEEPTEVMCKTSLLTTKEVKMYWPQLLNASPLGEKAG